MIPQDKMADHVPHTFETATINLLLGSDQFWYIIGADKIMLPFGIFMLSSKFGHIITEKCPEVECDEKDKISSTMLGNTSLKQVACNQALFCSVNVSLVQNPNLKRFWYLETIGIMDPIGRESDNKILEMFCKTIKFEDGRYQVTWPWKSDKLCISDNFDVAQRGLHSHNIPQHMQPYTCNPTHAIQLSGLCHHCQLANTYDNCAGEYNHQGTE